MMGLVPEGLSLVAFWTVVAASFATSCITAAFGIGGGAILLVVMASVLPTAALIPVHGVVQLGSNAGRMALMLRAVFWKALPWFAVGSGVGASLGGALVVELPPQLVQIGVGCFVIYTVIARPPAWLGRWPLISGLVSTFLTMFFGATGLFVASFVKSLALPRHDHVATHAALMTVQHTLKVLVFGFLGFAFGPWLGVIAAMIAAGLLGTLAGGMILNRMTDKNFKGLLDVLLVLVALRLIWSGVSML